MLDSFLLIFLTVTANKDFYMKTSFWNILETTNAMTLIKNIWKSHYKFLQIPWKTTTQKQSLHLSRRAVQLLPNFNFRITLTKSIKLHFLECVLLLSQNRQKCTFLRPPIEKWRPYENWRPYESLCFFGKAFLKNVKYKSLSPFFTEAVA